jgi:cation diffusion facilitator CzcD-associated flavoprotein CzcO
MTGEVHRKLDVLIYATGFDIVSSIESVQLVGRGGVSLPEAWQAKGGPEAFNGVNVPGFPNFFLLLCVHHYAASFTASDMRHVVCGARVAVD